MTLHLTVSHVRQFVTLTCCISLALNHWGHALAPHPVSVTEFANRLEVQGESDRRQLAQADVVAIQRTSVVDLISEVRAYHPYDTVQFGSTFGPRLIYERELAEATVNDLKQLGLKVKILRMLPAEFSSRSLRTYTVVLLPEEVQRNKSLRRKIQSITRTCKRINVTEILKRIGQADVKLKKIRQLNDLAPYLAPGVSWCAFLQIDKMVKSKKPVRAEILGELFTLLKFRSLPFYAMDFLMEDALTVLEASPENPIWTTDIPLRGGKKPQHFCWELLKHLAFITEKTLSSRAMDRMWDWDHERLKKMRHIIYPEIFGPWNNPKQRISITVPETTDPADRVIEAINRAERTWKSSSLNKNLRGSEKPGESS